MNKDEKEAAAARKKAEAQAKKEEEFTSELGAQAAAKQLEAKHEAETKELEAKLAAEAEAKKILPGRDKRWKEHLDRYEKSNPLKFAAKKAGGEFDKIPDTFL